MPSLLDQLATQLRGDDDHCHDGEEQELPSARSVAKQLKLIFKRAPNPDRHGPNQQRFVTLRYFTQWFATPADLEDNFDTIHTFVAACGWRVPPLHWIAACLMWLANDAPSAPVRIKPAYTHCICVCNAVTRAKGMAKGMIHMPIVFALL